METFDSAYVYFHEIIKLIWKVIVRKNKTSTISVFKKR